jgi:ATP-dependent exoDNAse (exonuclease V) beta subunit
MSERQPPDIDARQAAIDPERSFIVQAPAGSGKTSLLTDRILALLARVQTPEQVVAMTFTRKAAAEMHARVMEKLQRATSDTPPEDAHELQGWLLARQALAQDQAQGWGLLSHPARLRIQTIDSFCASLVRAMPWLTGLGGMPQIVDDAPALYAEAARRTVESADTHEDVRALLTHLDLAVGDVVQAVSDMLGKRDQWLPLLNQADDTGQLAGYLHQTLSEELQMLAAAMPVGWQHTLAPWARQAAQALIDAGQPDHAIATLLDWQAGDLQPEPDDLPRWQGVAELLLTASGELRKQVNKNQGFVSGSPVKKPMTEWLKSWPAGLQRPEWVAQLAAIRYMPNAELNEEQLAVLKAQLASLRLAAAHLMVVFAERGEVDFIEVAQRAVQALGHADAPSDLLLKLDNRISHLLVDEFQDTSQTQLRLLELLTAGWQFGDGRTLFLVGDPMQSIYRFRKAEVSLFLQVQSHGLGAVELEPLRLTANFRSQGGVVDWVNRTFGPMFPTINQPLFGAIRYEPADAWRDTQPDIPAVNWHVQTDQAEAWQQVVAIALRAWQAHADSGKPMAILVRSRPHLGEVTRELAKAGLPCRAIELDSLRAREAVVDLLQLTRALVHRGDRAAWLAVLRAPWCGLTLGTLKQLFGQPQSMNRAVCDVLLDCLSMPQAPEGVTSDQWQRLLGVAHVLLEALRSDGALALAARIEATWRALQGHRVVRQASDLQDVQAFLQLVQRLATHSELDLDELERQLAKLYAQPQHAGRAIEVMTMHKAKGLEFEVVVLLGLERQPRSDQSPLVRIEQLPGRVLFGPLKARTQDEHDPLSLYLAKREGTRQRYEVDRLLYVAATRARTELNLVAVLSTDSKTGDWAEPKASSLLARLWPYRPQLEIPVKASADGDGADGDGSDSDSPAQPWWVAPTPQRRSVPLEVKPTIQSLSAAGADRYSWPVTESPERISGILIHAWLARFASGSVSERPVVPEHAALERQLRALGMPAPLRADAAVEVASALTAMLESAHGQWLLAQPLRQVEWALIDTRQTVSIMDLAIDLPEGWLVVDYKTSRPFEGEDRGAFEARMVTRYGTQMQRYREQLQALDGRGARSVLYFPRDDIWLEVS